MKVTNEIIEHISFLSRLEFNGNEKNEIREDMEKIIVFMQQLQKVDTTDVKPLISISKNVNVLRKDQSKKSIQKKDAFVNAPKNDSDYFRISKVLKK